MEEKAGGTGGPPFIPLREAGESSVQLRGTEERSIYWGLEQGYGENVVQINMASEMSLQTKGNRGI